MSSHVPNTMTWQRKRGVSSSVASADCHQQTRRAMEASCSELFSVVSALFTTFWMQEKYNKSGVDIEFLRCRQSVFGRGGKKVGHGMKSLTLVDLSSN